MQTDRSASPGRATTAGRTAEARLEPIGASEQTRPPPRRGAPVCSQNIFYHVMIYLYCNRSNVSFRFWTFQDLDNDEFSLRRSADLPRRAETAAPIVGRFAGPGRVFEVIYGELNHVSEELLRQPPW